MADVRRAIDICTCDHDRHGGPCRCGCPEFIPHPQPGRASDRLSDDAEVIATAGDALRKAEGRGSWSMDNLPGRDVDRARLMLIAVDMLLASRRVR